HARAAPRSRTRRAAGRGGRQRRIGLHRHQPRPPAAHASGARRGSRAHGRRRRRRVLRRRVAAAGSVTMADTVPIRAWVAVWRAAQFFSRSRVGGPDKAVRAPASLIVGYHARPVAWDPAMLTVPLYDELGYLPHGFLPRGVDGIPPLRWFADGLGYVTRDDPR